MRRRAFTLIELSVVIAIIAVLAAIPPFCASASEDSTVRVWQPSVGRMVRIARGAGGPVLAVAYSPDGTRLCAAGSAGEVRAVDAESDRLLSSWTAHADWAYSLAVRPDGRRLATGDWSGAVKLLEAATGKPAAGRPPGAERDPPPGPIPPRPPARPPAASVP